MSSGEGLAGERPLRADARRNRERVLAAAKESIPTSATRILPSEESATRVVRAPATPPPAPPAPRQPRQSAPAPVLQLSLAEYLDRRSQR